MKCPACMKTLDAERTKALLEQPVEGVTLLRCGVCCRISLLRGGALETLTKEHIDEMSDHEREHLTHAMLRLRALSVGPEKAIEEFEQAQREETPDGPTKK